MSSHVRPLRFRLSDNKSLLYGLILPIGVMSVAEHTTISNIMLDTQISSRLAAVVDMWEWCRHVGGEMRYSDELIPLDERGGR